MDLFPQLKTPHNLIYYLGLFFFLKNLYKFLKFLQPFLRKKPLNLLTTYGPDSYVAITGSSDGLGKALAFEFASLGFNLILIARNHTKLALVKEEILLKFPKILIKIIVVNFLESQKAEFFEKIEKDLENHDISILINNVALDYCDEFLKTPVSQIESLMTVNLHPLVFLTYKLLPRLLLRPKTYKSAIINISSISGVLPTPFFAIYSSTKAFMEAFTKTLREEYRGKVEFLVVRPNFMSTAMNFFQKKDFETVAPEDCAKGILKDLGRCEVSNGDWKHHLLNEMYQMPDERIVSWFYMKFMGRGIVERCQLGRKKM